MQIMEIFDHDGKATPITGAGDALGVRYARTMDEAGAHAIRADIDAASTEQAALMVAARWRRGKLSRVAQNARTGESLASRTRASRPRRQGRRGGPRT